MAYTTLQNIKMKLWISEEDVSQDNKLEYYLNATTSIMDSIFGVSLLYWEKTQQFDICPLSRSCSWVYFAMKCPNIKSVTKINWIDYTWVVNDDYKIIETKLRNELYIEDFKSTTVNNDFHDVVITYVAWYESESIPFDLSFAQDLLIEWYMSQINWRDVITEKSWPRSVTFATKEDSQKFYDLIGFYTPVVL